MNSTTLNQLLKDCHSNDLNSSLEALDDLGYLVEKYTVTRSNEDKNKVLKEYMILFNRKELVHIELSIENYNYILYYLFYLLLNFTDRSSRVAWCLGKCYDKSIQKGICISIEAFMNINSDETVIALIKAITDINDYHDLNKETLELFHKVKDSKLSLSSDFARTQLDFYNKHY